MAKQRLKNEDLVNVNNSEIIGINWGLGVKGIVIRNEEGFFSLNYGEVNVSGKIKNETLSGYLMNIFKNNPTKPTFYKFKKYSKLLKWFAR